jgi:pantoate kinase
MRPGGPNTERVAAAFAPGHLTGLFAPALGARDPRARGSLGAGLVLPLGVRASARWTPGGPSRWSVSSDLGTPLPISEEVTRRLLAREPGTLELFLAHELPVGAGFGMSAAGAVATSLAAGQVLGRSRARSLEVAHLADLFGGGGLGGVAAILGGGLELRTRAGLPPRGRVLHRPFRPPVWVATVGPPLPSRPLLLSEGFRDRAQRAAESGLLRLTRAPASEAFLEESERFTDTVRLASPALRRLIQRLRGTGARTAQAMLGRTVFAVAPSAAVRRALVRGFERSGLRAVELRVAVAGARPTPLRTSARAITQSKGF